MVDCYTEPANGREYADFQFDEYPQPDDRYLYHYTTARGLAGIIDSRSLIFSAFQHLNDPRENQSWSFSMQGINGVGTAISVPVPDDALGLINQRLREQVRLFCATTEDPGESPDATFLRGFSRARNWAQYGDDHRGACLVFDRKALVQATKRAADDADPSSKTYSERIVYEDSQAVITDGWRFIALPLNDMPTNDWMAAAGVLQQEHWRAFYFRKNTDWQSEREYRITVVGIDPEADFRVDISDSLAAVALGQAFPESEASVLNYRLDRSGFPYVVVARMIYTHGAPDARSAGRDLDARYRNCRK